MKYAVARGEQTLGSYTKEDILTYSKTGQILPSDLWYNVGTNQWEPIIGLIQFFSATSTPTPRIVTPPTEVKKSSPFKGCFIAGLILLAVFMGIGMIGVVSQATHPTNDAPTPHLALVYGQKIMAKSLKAPSTAQFSPDDDSATFYDQRKDGDFFVGGWVDSQNGFGAMIRTKWKMVLHYNPETKYWTSVWYRLGEDETGDFPKDTQ